MNHKFTVFGYFSKTTPIGNLPPNGQKVANKFMPLLLAVFFMAFYLPFVAQGQNFQTPASGNNWSLNHWSTAVGTKPSTCPSGSNTFGTGNWVYLCTSSATGSGATSGNTYGIIAIANYTHSSTGTLTFTSTNTTPTIEVDGTGVVVDFTTTKFSSSYALVKIGTGTLVSSPSSSSFSGGFTLQAGTMVVGSNSALGSGILTIPATYSPTLAATSSSSLSNTLHINSGFTLGTTAYTSNITFNGNAILANSPTITLGGSSTTTPPSTYSFSGTLSGSSALTVSGTGGILALTNTSANSFTGNVTITGSAELDINNDGDLGAGSNVTLNSGTLKLVPTGSVTTARGIALSPSTSNTININNTGGELVCTGVISGTGSLTKTGAGVLQVDNTAGTNTASGTVTVNAGDLDIAIGASIPASVSVGSGAIVSGVGTYGAVTIGSGGSISPGTDLGSGLNAGTLTTGSQTWQSGGVYTCTINDNNLTGTAGTDWDNLTINGGLSVDPTGFIVKLEATGNTISGFDGTASFTWPIGTYTGSVTAGTLLVTVDQSAIDGGVPYPGTFSIAFTSGTNGTINLVYTAPDFNYYWTGATSSDWTIAGNWLNAGAVPATAPGSSSNVIISTGYTNAPDLPNGSPVTINSLTVNSGTLTLEDELITNGDVTNSGTITLATSTDEGSLDVGAGTMEEI